MFSYLHPLQGPIRQPHATNFPVCVSEIRARGNEGPLSRGRRKIRRLRIIHIQGLGLREEGRDRQKLDQIPVRTKTRKIGVEAFDRGCCRRCWLARPPVFSCDARATKVDPLLSQACVKSPASAALNVQTFDIQRGARNTRRHNKLELQGFTNRQKQCTLGFMTFSFVQI